ncbi:class I SAM-dependent methyltransferase [Bacillus solimangrovi]|uniref:Methyltransferase domain-containing protein n=1 Tax=Bacillus solimangrovi TaxID=1305675 RepID=A0A1E5LBC5_9BACI|nr:class I SAM-dependent methyltransferase [Bacillus solimangrovi]OEH91381.1 hypothetical protein BFG57_05815 [Bacillus solimangrovi]
MDILVIIIAILITISIVFDSLRNGMTPTPSSQRVTYAIVNYLSKQKLNKNMKVYDLGCGWGTLIFPLAKQLPTAKVHGLDNALIPYLYCRIRNLFCKHKTTIHYSSFYTFDFTDANCIICYLYPKAMKQLKERFESELDPNCLIVSHFFAIPDWTPIHTIEINDLHKTNIYIYQPKHSYRPKK